MSCWRLECIHQAPITRHGLPHEVELCISDACLTPFLFSFPPLTDFKPITTIQEIDGMGDAGVDIEIVSSKAGYHIACHRPRAASLAYSDYTVGWICALPRELTAATAMLDEIHPDLPKPPDDTNTYTLGSIGQHNIVIACLTKGRYGNTKSGVVGVHMIRTFPSIKVGLMVGIGGGIPPKVRLGDVVVSAPVNQYPGVVQWDIGTVEEGGKLRRSGELDGPPSMLLTALTHMTAASIKNGYKIPGYLADVEKKWPRLVPQYTRPPSLMSRMPTPINRGSEQVDPDGSERQSHETCVHHGLIATGNKVIKDAEIRDSMDESLGGDVLCVEMEAAGLMNSFPCLVIRGICDYADAQKNKVWQHYAAAVAAACAKELLQYVTPNEIDEGRSAREILGRGQSFSNEGPEYCGWRLYKD